MSRIAVIGGGAAGMMAAAAAIEKNPNARVALFEKNKMLGAKVLISGGGRCNITTGVLDVREVLKNYPRGSRFLKKALFRFPPQAVIDWFSAHGVETKIESDGRVFPAANTGEVVVTALKNAVLHGGGEIRLGTSVRRIERKADIFTVRTAADGEEFDAVILATGGTAYRQTGSTGDGYAFAAGLGHTITPLAPSLNSFVVAQPWVARLAGVSLQEVRLQLGSGASLYERTGPVIFTHRGVSGPGVFALSSLAAYENYSAAKPIQARVDFFPRSSREELEKKLRDLIARHPKKNLKNLLDLLLPASLASAVADLADFHAHAGELPRAKLALVLESLKNLAFDVTGRGAGDEFVTAGGVACSEIDGNSMESLLCPGLYITGELLDVDGFTGGFNLQAAWSTGRLAGESAARVDKRR